MHGFAYVHEYECVYIYAYMVASIQICKGNMLYVGMCLFVHNWLYVYMYVSYK